MFLPDVAERKRESRLRTNYASSNITPRHIIYTCFSLKKNFLSVRRNNDPMSRVQWLHYCTPHPTYRAPVDVTPSGQCVIRIPFCLVDTGELLWSGRLRCAAINHGTQCRRPRVRLLLHREDSINRKNRLTAEFLDRLTETEIFDCFQKG